jgi:hypothetical protein
MVILFILIFIAVCFVSISISLTQKETYYQFSTFYNGPWEIVNIYGLLVNRFFLLPVLFHFQ